MENDQIVNLLIQKFGDKIEKLTLNPPQAGVRIKAAQLLEMVKFINADPELKIDYLSSISAVDYLDQGMEMVYHFSSCQLHHKLIIKVPLDRNKPEIPTIMEQFPGANWYEREAWELFGIQIVGHPNLKTFLLSEDWGDQGWPMRRDWDKGKDFIKMPEF